MKRVRSMGRQEVSNPRRWSCESGIGPASFGMGIAWSRRVVAPLECGGAFFTGVRVGTSMGPRKESRYSPTSRNFERKSPCIHGEPEVQQSPPPFANEASGHTAWAPRHHPVRRTSQAASQLGRQGLRIDRCHDLKDRLIVYAKEAKRGAASVPRFAEPSCQRQDC